MRNIWTIGVREFKGFYTSAVGYVVLACWLFFSGIIHFLVVASPQAQASMEALFHNWAILLVILMPLITMRQLAGERSGDQGIGTIELLLTSPVSEWELVLGKFSGAVLYMLSLMVVSLIFPISLAMSPTPMSDRLRGLRRFFCEQLRAGLPADAADRAQSWRRSPAAWGVGIWRCSIGKSPPRKWVGDRGWSWMKHHVILAGLITFTDVAWYGSMIFLLLLAAKQVIASSRWR